jgi:hypothetical protein
MRQEALYLLRLWSDQAGEQGAGVWRVRLQNLRSGSVQHFGSVTQLEVYLTRHHPAAPATTCLRTESKP